MHVEPVPATYVGHILTAVRSFNQARVSAVLDAADAADTTIDTTIDEIVFPTLRVVGTFWSSGTIDVAHEHLLSTAVARWIAARSAVLPGPSRKGTILLAAGPQEAHTLALDCLYLLLASRGVEVCNLASHTPTVASQAVRVSRPWPKQVSRSTSPGRRWPRRSSARTALASTSTKACGRRP